MFYKAKNNGDFVIGWVIGAMFMALTWKIFG
jgi:hypothetical protein